VLELLIDPDGDGLRWKNDADFQIGIRAEEENGGTRTWSWFQTGGGEDPSERAMLTARSYVDDDGYVLEGKILWRYLNLFPEPGLIIRVSPALHDIDRDRTECKLQWHFRNEEAYQRFTLGKLILG
jgi:hypothetical protein